MMRVRKWLSTVFIGLGCLLALLMLLVSVLSPWVVTNIDESLPGLFYKIEHGLLPTRNEVVGLRVPANPYYPTGAPFLKVVKGLPGDVVSRVGRHFYINGKFVAEAKEQTRRGNPLTLGPVGVIPPGHYFIWTPHSDSYDSRYGELGWVTTRHIIGTAGRLL